MKTLTTIEAWILICSIITVTSATEHASSQHVVSHHGDSTPKKKLQNTIVPFGIRIPEHVLSTQDVACISADSNIFEIMNKAQESCNGTDMRCTFYHFVNHGYKNIGTLDINKELFDDLLMKFDNWLLTAENIEKHDELLNRKTKEDTPLDMASINVNGGYSNEESISNSTHGSHTEKLYTNHGVHIDKVDHNTNEFDDDKIVSTHLIKNVYDTHHRNHHHKSKNGNHIKLVPEYNNDHRYFEVYLSKDKETGKPRTIYVEVDKDKNKFVLLDEEIDKKLNGVKPIRVELDELSEIADTAFNNIAKPSNHKQHIYNSNDDDRIMSSDINKYSAIDEDTTNLDIDVREYTQNILNPSIRNINTNQQRIPDNKTGNVKKTVNVGKNLVVPNKYINQAQFYIESQIDNTTHEIPNDDLELLESTNNETDIYQTGFDGETPLDTIEFNENNTSIVDVDNIVYFPENFYILSDDNSTEHYEISTDDENVTFDDDSFIQLEENNDTSIDIDFDDAHDFSTSETTHLNEPISQTEYPVQENKTKSTPNIYTEPKLTPSLTAGISDYISSQRDAITSDNRQGRIQEHSSEAGIPLSTYTNVPIMEEDLAKVLETDSHLQSSFPVYATLDLPAGASQKSPLDSDTESEIFPYTSPISPTPRIASAAPNFQYTSPVFPSPPVECVVRLNKGSKYSPLNFGFSWLPPYSRIEELRLPCAINFSPQGSIMPLPELQNEEITGSIYPNPSSPDHTSVEDLRLFHTVPLLSVNSQAPFLSTEPYHLEANVPMPLKHTQPSKLDLPKFLTDLDRMPTAYELSETPLSVMPNILKDAVNSPCHMQQIPLYLQQAKPNAMDLGLIKYSPFDNNFKETMIPCSANRNKYPYTTIPCFANPYLKPPQIIPPYLEPLLPVTPLQPSSKIPTLDSLPISLDQSYPYLNGDYRQETKPNSFVPHTAFPPINPQVLGPGFIPNTLPCQNLWNNIPNLPCTILPDQNIRNYPPILSNYVTPSAVLQQNQILKPLLSKSVTSSALEQPCQAKNILEMTPLSYTQFLPPGQMDLNPSLALEHDLQSLSLKYGIPLSKILNSLETEISDAHSKTSTPTFEVPYSKLVHDSSLTIKPISTKTNAALDDENRSGYEESLLDSDLTNPLDSSLIGPHLELESSLILASNNSQSHAVISETTVLPSLHSGPENPKAKVIHDSSLIGPNLPTLSISNFVLNDENLNANEYAISESDISNSILLDSPLLGPHLEIGSPPIVLDSNNSHSDILASRADVPITVSSQIEPKLNIENPPTNILDSSLIVSHLPTLSPIKPLLSNEIQNINDMIPLETDLTDLTPLDSSAIDTQEDLVNQIDQTEILQHEETAVTLTAANATTKLNKTTLYLPTNLVQEELLLESDSSRFIPLDSSLIGPELKLGSLPIITDSLEDKTIPQVSKESLQHFDNKVDELESIILPPSLLPTFLNKTVKADSNLNINTQETKLNEELDELSVDTNVELPLTDIAFKEKDFKILEIISELPSLAIDESNIALQTKDSRTIKHKSKSSDISPVVDSERTLDSSLTGSSILHKLDKPEISTSLDSSIHLDSSLIGPSILKEIDSREISQILDTDSSLPPTTINQIDKPSEILTVIDSSNKLGSSFKSPTIHHEINSKETSTAFESVTQFDNSLVPILHETKESPATSSISKSQLDSSFISPSLHQETLEVSRAFDSKDLRDSLLVGPRLLTAPFSGDEIQIINKELQSESDLANLVPLDSSLIGPHVNFESELEQSEISRYQNPELSKTSGSNPDAYDTTNFTPLNLVEGKSPLEPITVSSVYASDLEELLSKFTNAITKSQLSPTELKPCDKLLSSIAKISSDNKNIQPCCKDLQTLTLNTLLNSPLSLQNELASEFHPISITFQAQEFSPVESIANGLNSNYFPTPTTMAESGPYAQGVPQTPTTPYSPFVQMKSLIDRNWIGPNNMQNILQTSPNFRPVLGNPPAPFTSNALPLTSEDLKSLLDLASYSNLSPQSSNPNKYTPGDAIAPSAQWTKPSNILPLNEYIPLLPNKHSSVLPFQSTIANSEYNPIVVDDIMSLLDENSFQLLRDTSILPFSQSSLLSTIPVFDKGEIVSPSLLETVPILKSGFIKTRPLLHLITNPKVPSSNHNQQIRLYNPQNIPYIIQTPNFIPPCNLQPYSILPLHSQLSKRIGPAPKLVTLPTEFPREFLQQILSKPCLESPIILPSASLDTMFKSPIASNKLNSVLSQLPPEYFEPISPIYTTPLSNELTKPVLPNYASPLSVSLAKPISPPSTSLPLNIPYVDTPLTPLSIPITPYTAQPLTPKYPSPVMPLKITPISDYAHSPTVPHNVPIASVIPYKPSQTYSSPHLPVPPIPIDKSPGSPNIMTELPPAMTSPISPVLYEPLSTPCFNPVPKSLTNLGLPAYSNPLTLISLSTLAPTPTGLLSPDCLSPTNSYPSLPAPINTQTRSSNLLTPASITPISPVSSSLSSFHAPLSLNPKIIIPELKSRLLDTLPISNTENQFINANQWLPINSNIPLQSDPTHVSKSLPPSFSNSQIKQYIPSEHALESNLLTSPLIEEIPPYDVIEESAFTYSNDKDDKYYAEPSLKYPLESESYTLAPEEIAATLPPEDFIKLEDLTPSATVNNRASEPSLHKKTYGHHRPTPYTPLYGKPLLKQSPAPQLLPPLSLIEAIPQSILDNTSLVPSSSPLKHPVSLPTSILSSPLLKPLALFTSAPNFPISSPTFSTPFIDTSLTPYNMLPINEKLQSLSSSPYYFAQSQDMSSPPIDPRELRIIVTPQVTPVLSQVPTNAHFVSVSSPKSQTLISPSILDNYIQLPSTHNEPKSKTLICQGSLVEPLPIPSYTQFAAPIISHIPPLEMPISLQYITPSSPAATLKKLLISPQYMSSKLPAQTTFPDTIPLNEAPIHYQPPYIEQPTVLTSSEKSMFKSRPVTSPYTVLPSINMVEPVITDLNRLQSSSLTSHYSLPSTPLPVSKYSPIISYCNHPSRISPPISKQALTNHIIPSSLFISSDTDLQTPTNKLFLPYNIPRYSSPPSLSLIEPLASLPFNTPSRPLDMTANLQNILKPKSPIFSDQYTVPLSSSPYHTQPLQPRDFYQTQPFSNVQYSTKPHPKSSTVQAQYASPSSTPTYTSLPFETVPYRPINQPSTPQYSLSSAPVYDSPTRLSSLARNPFLNPDFKPITEVPSYPVPNNIISLPILTPSESILLSNLRPLDISQESLDSYSSPMTSPTPLSLLKPLAKRLPQKSRQYQPDTIPSNAQYLFQLPIEIVPELLQSTLQKSSLLKPLSTNFQNNAPFSNTNLAFPEDFPIEAVPYVPNLDVVLSNYLPSDSSNHKHSGPYDSLVSEIPEIVTPTNPSSTTPYISLKSPFNKQFKSPVSTVTNMPLYSNFDILEPSPKLPVKASLINTAKPIEVSATSALESSPLSLDALDTEMIEEIEPYELVPGLKDRFLPLPLSYNKHRHFHPAFISKYLVTPQPTKTLPSSKYKTLRPRPSFSIPSKAELIDTTDFIPLSQIKSEPLIADYTPADKKAPIPHTPSNIPEPDIVQLSPYHSLLNTYFPLSTNKQLPPKSQIPRYSNQIIQPSPIHLSPQEYKGTSPSQASSSSPTVLSPTNTEPQLVTSTLTGPPSQQIPFYTSPISIAPENWLQSPDFAKIFPLQEMPLEVTPEKESIQTLLKKYRFANKIIPQGNNYPYELDSIKPVNPLLKSKEPYTEYIEDSKSNEDNYHDSESDIVSSDENKPTSFKSKSFTKSPPEVMKGVSVPNYNNKVQRPQRLSKFDHFYANNHIGKGPQVYTVPTYNTLPVTSTTGVKSPSSSVSPVILKDFTDIPTTHFGSVPKLDTTSLPSEYYPEITESPENVPTTKSYPQNYLNPYLKYCSQIKSPPNTIVMPDISVMTSMLNTTYNNIDDIKYSGYKTYQIPSFKSPQTPKNLGTPTRMYSPSVVTNSYPIPAVKPLKVHQIPAKLPNVHSLTEIPEALTSQYQVTTPLQRKFNLDSLQESPEFNEYNPIEDIPTSFDSRNEDNELKASLINYMNRREDVKNNLFNNNAEITIPLGNIAITRKEPYNTNTIETNNPSIGLKVWKSNVKIAQAELKLKFKDLSVNNFMPIVNNIDEYDMEEIRKIVKNYIDEKYGNHIEINEPYDIDNKYTVIEDFDHNAVDNKYNLLWPTNYV